MGHIELPPKMQFADAFRLACPKLRFHTNSHLARPVGLKVVLYALAFTADPKNDRVRLLLAGHTDAQGAPADNLDLSTRRALNVLWLLIGDMDKWAASALESYQNVKDTSAGELDLAEVRALHADFAKLKASDFETEGFWKRVFSQYSHALHRWSGPKNSPPLVTGIFSHTDATGHLPPLRELQAAAKERLLLGCDGEDADLVLGCGAAFPIQNTSGASPANRRIDFLWFEDDAGGAANTAWVPWEDPQTGKIEKPQIGSPEDVPKVAAGIYPEGTGWKYDHLACPESLIDVPNRSVLVIDVSGSMGRSAATGDKLSGPDDTSRLDAAKSMLTDVLRGFDAGQQLAVGAFGGSFLVQGIRCVVDAHGGAELELRIDSSGKRHQVRDPQLPFALLKYPPAEAEKARKLTLTKLDEGGLRDLVDWVDWLPLMGGTELAEALFLALGVSGARRIVLLSDGGPSGAFRNEAKLTAKVHAALGSRQLHVYGFVYGNEADFQSDCDACWQAQLKSDARDDYNCRAWAAEQGWDRKKETEFGQAYLGYFLKKLSKGGFHDLTTLVGKLKSGVPIHSP